jgi:hypothetical protein
MDTRVKILIAVAVIIAAIAFIVLKPEPQPEILFGVGSASAPEYKGGADATGLTNSGTGSINFGVIGSGPSVAVSGNYAFVTQSASSTACSSTANAAGNGCELKVFDISDPTAPAYVGGGDASGTTNTGTGSKNFTAVALSGNYALIATAGSATDCSSAIGCELQVWDISTPSAPAYVGGADASGAANSGTGAIGFTSVDVSGDVAYTTGDANLTNCNTAGNKAGCEIKVWDISTKSAPSFSGGGDSTGATNSGTGGSNYLQVHISGSYLYVGKVAVGTNCNTAASKVGCEIQIWDVSTPASPTFAVGIDAGGEISTSTVSASAQGLYKSGNYLYVAISGLAGACSSTASATNGCELKVFDVTTPASPTYVGGLDSSGTTNSGTSATGMSDVFVNSSLAYIVASGSATDCSDADKSGCEFKIVDVSTPATPTFLGGGDIGGTTNTGTTNTSYGSVFITGHYAYLTKQLSGTACSSAVGCELQIWEVSTVSAASKDDVIFFD